MRRVIYTERQLLKAIQAAQDGLGRNMSCPVLVPGRDECPNAYKLLYRLIRHGFVEVRDGLPFLSGKGRGWRGYLWAR